MAVNRGNAHVLLVEVTGLGWQGKLPTSHYTFRVPYRSLAPTLRFIKQRGGQIVRVQWMASSLSSQDTFQRSDRLEGAASETLDTAPSSPSMTNLEAPLPSKVHIESADEIRSPISSEQEGSEIIRKPGLVMLFMEKLRWLFRDAPER